MTTADKLKLLLARCKCGVHLTVNEHRDYYDSVEQFLADREALVEDTASEIRQKMIEANTVVCIQFYPRTPVCFHVVYHHDLDAALDEALECLGGEDGEK